MLAYQGTNHQLQKCLLTAQCTNWYYIVFNPCSCLGHVFYRCQQLVAHAKRPMHASKNKYSSSILCIPLKALFSYIKGKEQGENTQQSKEQQHYITSDTNKQL